MPKTPTKRAYDDLDAAYEYFNKQLFASRLPPCLITVRPQTPQVGDSCQEWLRTLRRSGNGQGAQEREEAGTYGSGPYRRARLGTAAGALVAAFVATQRGPRARSDQRAP